MTEPLDDTWHNRDLIVLRTVVRLFDLSEHKNVRAGAIESESGLSSRDVTNAAIALFGDGLIDITVAGGNEFLWVNGVTGEARRKSGAWPSAESIADRLLVNLQDLAEYSGDPVEKTKAKKALDGLGSFSRDTLVSLIGAAAGVAMQ